MERKRHDVLVVEDDRDLRDDLAFLIRDQGYDVMVARDGLEALALLRGDEPPRVILLDLMMPRMDGWTFRAEMLRDPHLAEIPVVLMSGVMDPEYEAKKVRAFDHLEKPLDLRKLFGLLERTCAGRV